MYLHFFTVFTTSWITSALSLSTAVTKLSNASLIMIYHLNAVDKKGKADVLYDSEFAAKNQKEFFNSTS